MLLHDFDFPIHIFERLEKIAYASLFKIHCTLSGYMFIFIRLCAQWLHFKCLHPIQTEPHSMHTVYVICILIFSAYK